MCLNVMIDLVYCTDMTLLHSMGGVAYPILMGQRNLTYRLSMEVLGLAPRRILA